MTIAEEKIKQSTARFDLVRLSPRRHLSSAMVLIDAANKVYTVDMGFAISIESLVLTTSTPSTVTFTRTTSNPPTSDGTYYADEDAGTLVIRTGALAAGGPNETTTHYVLTHRIYLSTRGVIAAKDTNESTEVSWEPRLSEPVSVSQSFANQPFGKFTFGNTSISIINDDRWFQKYVGSRDSFNRAAIKVWNCIGDVTNRALVFKGRISAIPEIRSTRVRLSAYDDLYTLEDTATMGDTAAQTAMSGGRLDDIGKPLPLIIAPRSYQKTTSTPTVPTGPGIGHYQTEATEGYVSTYSTTKADTVNRAWRLGRIIGSLPTQSFGTITRAATDGTFFYAFFTTPVNLYVGDTISWGVAQYGRIVYVGTFDHLGLLYNCAFETDGGAGFTSASTMNAQKALSITITGITPDGNYPQGVARPAQTRDWTITETATAGGHNLLSITFVNGFELGTVILDPDTHHVWWCAGTTASGNAPGAFMKRLMEAAGVTVNAATFTALDAAIVSGAQTVIFASSLTASASPYLNMSIPLRSESSYGSYTSYLSIILDAVLGYVRLNTSLEVEGYLVNAPSSADERDEYLGADISGEIEYRDLVSSISFTNEHSPVGSQYAGSQELSNLLTPKLHLITKVLVKSTVMNHTLLDDPAGSGSVLILEPARGPAILAFLANRRATYRLTTAAKDIETALGDDLLLSADVVVGSSESTQVTVIDIQKSSSKTSLKAVDLLGF